MYNIEAMLQKAIVATKKNHPTNNINETFYSAIIEYINNMSLTGGKKSDDELYKFCNIFSKKDNETDEVIRANLEKVFIDSKRDVVLYIFNLFYAFCIRELGKNPNDKNYSAVLLNYYNSYQKLKTKFGNQNLEEISDLIYRNSYFLIDLIENLKPISHIYINEVLKDKDITINIKNESAFIPRLLSNIKDLSSFSLRESFEAQYKYGNCEINMVSSRGYQRNYSKPQQDAILSISRDGCSLNVVADGAGGSNMGQLASTMVIDGLKNWFENLDVSKYNVVTDDKKEIINISSTLNREIEEKIEDISKEIGKINSKSYSTVVLAFITPSFISFVNVGDSTGYVYDKDKDKLILMSTIHSPTSDLSYEEARKNEENNKISSAVGGGSINYISSKICFNNGNKRILLSSDGITDLISEDNFIKTIKGDYSLKQIVDKAEFFPDVDSSFPKSADNISGIMIDINNNSKRGL